MKGELKGELKNNRIISTLDWTAREMMVLGRAICCLPASASMRGIGEPGLGPVHKVKLAYMSLPWNSQLLYIYLPGVSFIHTPFFLLFSDQHTCI